MQNFLQNIQAFLGRLTLGQQIALGLVVFGGLAILISVTYWASQPDHTLLFGDMEPSNASRVVDTLEEEGVDYDLRHNGTAVYVPRDEVHELRIQFAAEGVVDDGQAGYEIFDDGELGMTDFMQEMNEKRAMEGELAQTVSNLSQVERARVHLVLPERQPFQENQTEASASVVVQLSGRSSLSVNQVEGITALVSGAVDDLEHANVTILDSDGNMLSDPDAGDETARLTSTQLDLRREVEEYLTEQGQSMLDEVLGTGESIVRVSAELDFSRTVSESNIIDPESQTIISEERLDEESPQDEATSLVRNYDVTRTTEQHESSVGDVTDLSVSVVLNQPLDEDGEPAPFPPDELQEIEEVVQNAVGFDPERGDQFTIQQTRFDADDELADDFQEQQWFDQLELYLRYGLILIALLLGIWLIRSITQQRLPDSDRQLESGDDTRPALEGETADESALPGQADEDDVDDMVLVDDVYTSKLSSEAKARLEAKNQMYQEIQDQVTGNPSEAAELIRSWMISDSAQDRDV